MGGAFAVTAGADVHQESLAVRLSGLIAKCHLGGVDECRFKQQERRAGLKTEPVSAGPPLAADRLPHKRVHPFDPAISTQTSFALSPNIQLPRAVADYFYRHYVEY